jgi:hypothetical protein
MESNMIVFLAIILSSMFLIALFYILEFLQERNDYESKINRLKSEKFEMANRLKNQSDIIKALMDWKEESKSVD